MKNKIIWNAQGVLALVTLLSSGYIAFIYFFAIYTSGLHKQAIEGFLLLPLLGVFILLLISIGSFLKCKIALWINIIYSYHTISGAYAVVFLSRGNASFGFLMDSANNIAIVSGLLLSLCGFMLVWRIYIRK